jgi:hypothetical protein
MKEMQTCYSLRCGYVTDVEGTKCPKCGGRLRSARFIRRLGWIQLMIGAFLVIMMGIITFNVAPIMLHPRKIDRATSFTGSREQAQLILGFFVLVIVFGLGAILNGFWQVKTGKRNKWVAIVMLALVVLLVIAGWVLRGSLGD